VFEVSRPGPPHGGPGRFIFGIALLVCAVRADAGPYEFGPVTDGGHVAGTVHLAGEPPKRRPDTAVTVDESVCGAAVPDESLLVDERGGVRNAVVVLRGVARGTPLAADALVDNAHCRFSPRVLVAPRGRPLRIRNSDPVLHNTHAFLVGPPEVSVANFALANVGQTMDLERRLTGHLPPEGDAVVRLGCDVHPWMTGWVVVVDHPYAVVTGADGGFRIDDVPPGTYTAAVWHETLGRTEHAVTVTAGGTARVELTFPARP